jgi:hypothetical protein
MELGGRGMMEGSGRSDTKGDQYRWFGRRILINREFRERERESV